MKKIRNSIFTIVLASAALLSACKRTAVDEISTPSIISADADLQVVQPFVAFGYNTAAPTVELGKSAQGKLDFSTTAPGTVNVGFNFQLSVPATYRITLTGTTTNAQWVRTATGNSSEATTTSVKWTGESTNGIFFNDAQVQVQFEVLVNNSYVIKGADLLSNVDARTTGYNGRGFKTILLDDFESQAHFGNPYSDLLELKYFNSNLNFPNSANPYGGVQGKYCLWWTAFDEDLNTYGGGTDMNDDKKDAGSPLSHYGEVGTTNPDSLFINAYVCGTGKEGTSFLVIAWEKDDPALVFASSTNPAKYRTDRWGVEYPITWTGWQLVSIPYSAFKKLNASYGNGNGKLEPQRFGGVSIGIDSYPIGGKVVECYIDYIVATEGGPFKP